MADSLDLAAVFARYVALDDALDTEGAAARPRYARRCAALVALAAEGDPRVVAALVGERARSLRDTSGIRPEIRPVLAAGLAVAGRSGADYRAARESLLAVLQGRRRVSLPVAALTCAMAGRTDADDAFRGRIRSLAPLVASPWWSSASAWNGFYAAALAVRGDEPSATAARLAAARRALQAVGAPTVLVRDNARQLVLLTDDPFSAAEAWRRLEDARRARVIPRRMPASVLLAYAARTAAQGETAIGALAQARRLIDDLRPRAHHLVRPILAAGLAQHAAAPSLRVGVDEAIAAALLVAEANATMAAVAASTAAVAATSAAAG